MNRVGFGPTTNSRPNSLNGSQGFNRYGLRELASRATGNPTDPTKSGSASDQMGNLLRAEWDDYITRFAPYDKKLIDLAVSDQDNLAAVDRARSGVAASFDVASGTRQRNNERLGLSNVADVSTSLNRQTGNNRTLAELSVINKTRMHADDRDKSILSGDAAAGLKSNRLTGE